ncbi:MAG: ATP-dependent Clp protease adapter ClpS [Gammaproteobacteria bacterium]|nr:ATP-dependent Clp protease adapter ClpS [Gammaproteobacteria bacterium]
MCEYEAAILKPVAQSMDAIGDHAGTSSPVRLERRDPGDGGADTPPATPGSDTVVLTETAKPELKRPPMFRVILLNDDYTPQEFVVHVLETFFGMDHDKAWQLMMAVHTTGSATVGIYPRDVAETKSEQVNAYSQQNKYPLLSTVEMTD